MTGEWREENDSAVKDAFGKELCLNNSISAAPWLTQANYIFSQLKISSNNEDFKLVYWVIFSLEIGQTTQNPPYGYLFLCSPKDFEITPTDEEASSLGLPSITQRTQVSFFSWDKTVYAGLRKFDESKGFDPESQDLAKELGHPLYEVCVPTSVATKWNFPVDRDDESNYPSLYFMDDEIESNSHLASSCVEVLTMDDENFLEEFFSDERDCSDSYPEDSVLEIESNPSSCNQEPTAENEDSLQDVPPHDAVVGQQYSVRELLELVKFGLIVMLGFTALYEYAGVLL
ncbi:hypothetical protein MSAN_01105000 [Mycena sanguinolenta]|uniref:Uncharacterized protein n=1 Tax=Mycena sanguinolenta TaxID=230812 RepID=A0A8H6YSM2_9AGAR|nr:hypothetical protein MSAN_01105000 [Mycena sanguinolenta]